MISRNTKVLSISLPPPVFERINRWAEREKKTRSELVREMVNIYGQWQFERDWKKVREMGEDIKKRFNIRNEDELLEFIHDE